MSNMQTFTGWTSFEIGHLTTQYDQNFVIYTNPNENATGLNCKIRAIDLVQSNVYKYLAQGGLCQVTVRGIMYVAPQPEQGWIPTSTRYLQVSFIMQEQKLLSDEEERKVTTTTTSQQQRQQSTTSFTNGSKDVIKISQSLSEDDDDDDDADLDYDSIDVEEEERLHMNDPEYNDYDDSMEESDISSEDIDKLIAAAKEPLDMNYIKKRDAEDFLENEKNKKHKQNHSPPPNSSIIIDSD
ncbi:hypothetical protein INT45_007010 [Circinella minor]|uniref:Uncharacterized protein n=1 Tax=Circinella minor TaxID=1195481 RepID=A0A8H7VQG7_9FUNG|nr:hypothetical protein INT45_007010 [Circinella minor]